MYYQSSSEIQAADNNSIQTHYLMNPNFIGYSDTQPQSNMLFAASNPALAPHAPLQQDISSAATARHHYSVWGGGGDNINQLTPRGLSLSLSAHHQAGFNKAAITGDRDFPAANNPSSPSADSVQSAVIMGSKYLKAAQELLDEVVNVGNHRTDKAKPIKTPTAAAANKEAPSANKAAAADLNATQRHEIQMKKAKLNSMLDEVEQRCRHYHQQMQAIAAAIEQAAGPGSARSYTQLALKTIMKQFRRLKSCISAQVKALSTSLGEAEPGSEMMRLRFVDREQVGMPQSNVWRPQRGLPERAVSVLRAWLFQHFLHPYPKDSDKQMLAKQTGLTRSQVSNWFINARVRVWKPMVEEMYLQETSNVQPSNTAPIIKPEPTAAEVLLSTASPFIMEKHPPEGSAEKNPKKPRNNIDCLSMANINNYDINHGFRQGNNFSLSLALPPPHTFLSFGSPGVMELDGGRRINEAAAYNEIIDFQNRKSFPLQFLPDFVA